MWTLLFVVSFSKKGSQLWFFSWAAVIFCCCPFAQDANLWTNFTNRLNHLFDEWSVPCLLQQVPGLSLWLWLHCVCFGACSCCEGQKHPLCQIRITRSNSQSNWFVASGCSFFQGCCLRTNGKQSQPAAFASMSTSTSLNMWETRNSFEAMHMHLKDKQKNMKFLSKWLLVWLHKAHQQWIVGHSTQIDSLHQHNLIDWPAFQCICCCLVTWHIVMFWVEQCMSRWGFVHAANWTSKWNENNCPTTCQSNAHRIVSPMPAKQLWQNWFFVWFPCPRDEKVKQLNVSGLENHPGWWETETVGMTVASQSFVRTKQHLLLTDWVVIATQKDNLQKMQLTEQRNNTAMFQNVARIGQCWIFFALKSRIQMCFFCLVSERHCANRKKMTNDVTRDRVSSPRPKSMSIENPIMFVVLLACKLGHGRKKNAANEHVCQPDQNEKWSNVSSERMSMLFLIWIALCACKSVSLATKKPNGWWWELFREQIELSLNEEKKHPAKPTMTWNHRWCVHSTSEPVPCSKHNDLHCLNNTRMQNFSFCSTNFCGWHQSSDFSPCELSLWHSSHRIGNHCDMALMWQTERQRDRETDTQMNDALTNTKPKLSAMKLKIRNKRAHNPMGKHLDQKLWGTRKLGPSWPHAPAATPSLGSRVPSLGPCVVGWWPKRRKYKSSLSRESTRHDSTVFGTVRSMLRHWTEINYFQASCLVVTSSTTFRADWDRRPEALGSFR